jgi:hypothetical protein
MLKFEFTKQCFRTLGINGIYYRGRLQFVRRTPEYPGAH